MEQKSVLEFIKSKVGMHIDVFPREFDLVEICEFIREFADIELQEKFVKTSILTCSKKEMVETDSLDMAIKHLISISKSEPSSFHFVIDELNKFRNSMRAKKKSETECKAPETGTCNWTHNDEEEDGYYETSCNKAFTMLDGQTKDNDFKFCTFCGKPITESEPDSNNPPSTPIEGKEKSE